MGPKSNVTRARMSYTASALHRLAVHRSNSSGSPPAWPQHKILCETFDKLFRTVYTAPYILLEYLWNGTDLLLSDLAIVRFGNRLFRRGNLIIFEETVFTEKTGLRD